MKKFICLLTLLFAAQAHAGTIESYTNLTAPDGLEEAVVSDVTNSNATKNIQYQAYVEDRNLSKSVAGGTDVALSNAESLYGIITLTGTITANINATIPDGRERMFYVYNNTSGSYTVTFKTVSGTGVVIPQGIKELVYSDGTNVALIDNGDVPVGTILPFNPGYYTDGSNGGYTFKLGAANTVAAVNTWLTSNKPRYKVCDGTNIGIVNGSDIFDNAGAYLPNLTDDRFLMGDTAAGGTGGSSTMAHTHDVTTNGHTHTITHTHGDGTYTALAQAGQIGVAGGAFANVPSFDHTHDVSGTSGPSSEATTGSDGGETVTSDAASNTENRPLYLSCFYIMRVI